MLRIITGGNSFHNLFLSNQTSKGIISAYKLNNNILFVNTDFRLIDHYNSIFTSQPLIPQKSLYLFRFFRYSYLVL